MTGMPRIPRDIDPRRSKKERDADTQAERDRDAIDEFEDLTDEPVREGDEKASDGSPPASNGKKRQLREFEDLAGEPVSDEEDKEPGS